MGVAEDSSYGGSRAWGAMLSRTWHTGWCMLKLMFALGLPCTASLRDTVLHRRVFQGSDEIQGQQHGHLRQAGRLEVLQSHRPILDPIWETLKKIMKDVDFLFEMHCESQINMKIDKSLFRSSIRALEMQMLVCQMTQWYFISFEIIWN